MTEPKTEYKTIEIRLPLTHSKAVYAMIEGIQTYASLVRGAIDDLEAENAILQQRLTHIYRMIVGRELHTGWMQQAEADAILFDIILEETRVDHDDNDLPLPES